MVIDTDEKETLTQNCLKTDLVGKTIIKAQLGDEIKKLAIHNDDLTYDELVLMMQRVFKKYIEKNDDISLKYKDEDGDFITLTDNAELNTALEHGHCLKLLIIGINNKEFKLETREVKKLKKELQQMRDKINHLLDCLELKNFETDVDNSVIKHMQDDIDVLKNRTLIMNKISSSVNDSKSQFEDDKVKSIHSTMKPLEPKPNFAMMNGGMEDSSTVNKKQFENPIMNPQHQLSHPSGNLIKPASGIGLSSNTSSSNSYAPPQILPTVQHAHLPPPFNPTPIATIPSASGNAPPAPSHPQSLGGPSGNVPFSMHHHSGSHQQAPTFNMASASGPTPMPHQLSQPPSSVASYPSSVQQQQPHSAMFNPLSSSANNAFMTRQPGPPTGMAGLGPMGHHGGVPTGGNMGSGGPPPPPPPAASSLGLGGPSGMAPPSSQHHYPQMPSYHQSQQQQQQQPQSQNTQHHQQQPTSMPPSGSFMPQPPPQSSAPGGGYGGMNPQGVGQYGPGAGPPPQQTVGPPPPGGTYYNRSMPPATGGAPPHPSSMASGMAQNF